MSTRPARGKRRKITVTALVWPPTDIDREDLFTWISTWQPQIKPAPSTQAIAFARAVAWASGASTSSVATRTLRAAVRHGDVVRSMGVPLDGDALSYELVENTVRTRYAGVPATGPRATRSARCAWPPEPSTRSGGPRCRARTAGPRRRPRTPRQRRRSCSGR